MGHPEVDNRTPFAFEALFLAEEAGRPVVAPLVKATFDILSGGTIELAEEQIPVDFTGQHHGDPGNSSFRFEPEVAFTKAATDVVLIGHAQAASGRTAEMDVLLRVGPVGRQVRVTGDRVWTKRFVGASPTSPEPFEAIPLVYERAYGGWDRSHEDPERHSFHPGNPVGVGYRGKHTRFEEGSPLPNVEDPASLLTSYRGKSTPAGFGFTCPHWEPRRFLSGTFDDAWFRTRMPLLPLDFDRRYFNAGSAGLVAKGYLRGDETVLVRGASSEREISLRLPGVTPPVCRIAFRDRDAQSLATTLDTVILDLDNRKLMLLWRVFAILRDGPLDVRAIQINAENAPQRRVAAAPPSNVISLPSRRAA